MELKTYRARSMHEALALVRRELGPRAAVLQAREVHAGGLGWLGSERLIEVTASAEVAVPSRLPPRPAPAVEITPPRFSAVSGIDLTAASGEPASRPIPSEASARPARVDSTRPTPAGVATFRRLYADLIDVETPSDLARALVQQAMHGLSPSERDSLAICQSALLETIVRGIEIAGPIQTAPRERRLVALVGPTGVGKTTTLAKLAAHFRLQERRRVGLISLDTFRVAAVEQLRAYAQIIDLPLEVVAGSDQIGQALARLADSELILIDTAGCGPHDAARIEDLQSLLWEAQPDEVHLVLSGTSAASGLLGGCQSFAPLAANRLILTKLDESPGLGHLLPLLTAGKLPLSYLTDGQNVPGDVQLADAQRLARRILDCDPAAAP
jgi:flagellar biosynthesis protein FlhF